ncbi:hypothetical protein P4V29_17350 [Bacillus thuringiensis]|nr:hypothetical protein [Bacillus thuringiensis]
MTLTYKVKQSPTIATIIQEFYLNVVGYKVNDILEQIEGWKVLSERSGI